MTEQSSETLGEQEAQQPSQSWAEHAASIASTVRHRTQQCTTAEEQKREGRGKPHIVGCIHSERLSGQVVMVRVKRTRSRGSEERHWVSWVLEHHWRDHTL